MFDCDYCDSPEQERHRHVAAVARPSDPTELVAVMWACRPCGARMNLPTAEQLHREVEAGVHQGVMFCSV